MFQLNMVLLTGSCRLLLSHLLEKTAKIKEEEYLAGTRKSTL